MRESRKTQERGEPRTPDFLDLLDILEGLAQLVEFFISHQKAAQLQDLLHVALLMILGTCGGNSGVGTMRKKRKRKGAKCTQSQARTDLFHAEAHRVQGPRQEELQGRHWFGTLDGVVEQAEPCVKEEKAHHKRA